MAGLELRVLQYFLAVAREENITRAAQMLHITQPTLSRQLMQLEEELAVLPRAAQYCPHRGGDAAAPQGAGAGRPGG